MITTVKALARTATALSRNPLGLLAFCFLVAQVTVCMVLLQLGPGQGSERILLCAFLVANPLGVVAAMYRLVSRHHTKLYAPTDFRSEHTFLETLRLADRDQPQSLGSIRQIAGDDFKLLTATPPANGATRPEPGMHVRDGAAYFVTWRQQIFLVRHPSERPLPREVKALAPGCRLLPRRDWDREMQALADAAERIAGA